MAWKEMSVEELAHDLGIDVAEAREKQRLVKLIAKHRKKKGWTQTVLAKKVGVSQGRIAQIESGIGTRSVTFDVLLSVLSALGCEFKIVVRNAA